MKNFEQKKKNEKNKNQTFSQAKTSIQLWEKRLTHVSSTEKSQERFKKEQSSKGSIGSPLAENSDKSKPGNTNLGSFASEEGTAPGEEKMFSNKNHSVQKKFLKGYSKVHELKLVSIGLASPEKIQSWAEKELPNGKIFGEVTNANTFHYRTFQPTKGGLFCERIFGPLKDFECACGKRQKPTAFESKKILEHKQTTRYFCSNCDVEYTWSILRRYQLGYIKFNAPVTHLWYLKTNPSSLSIFFDMKRKDLESVVYCIDSLTLENMWKLSQQKGNFSGQISDLFQTWQNSFKYDNGLKNVEKRFSSKKRKKKIFRETFFSSFSKSFEKNEFSKKRSKNWSLVEKNSFFMDRKKPGFSIFKENFEKNQFFGSLLNDLGLCYENSFQPKIVQRVLEKKEKKVVEFLFFESLKRKLEKSSGHQNLQILFKENVGKQTSNEILFDFFLKNLFLRESTKVSLPLLWSILSSPASAANEISFATFPPSPQAERDWRGGVRKTLEGDLSPEGFENQTNQNESEKRKNEVTLTFGSLFFLLQFSFFFSVQKNEKKKYLRKVRFFFQNQKNKENSLPLRRENMQKDEHQKILFFFFFLVFFLKKIKKFQKQIFQNQKLQKFSPFAQKNFLKKHKKTFSFLQKIDFHPFFSAENFSSLSFDFENQKCFFSFHSQNKKNIAEDFLLPEKINEQNDQRKEESTKMKQNFEKIGMQKARRIEIFNTLRNGKQIVCFGKSKALWHCSSEASKKQKKLEEFRKFLNFDSVFVSNPFFQKQKRNDFFQTISDHKIQKAPFLKNPVLTMSSNFLWKNDSDWNSFVYYNSFGFSEFQDLPIFYFSSRQVFSSFSSSFGVSRPILGPGRKSNFSRNFLFEQKKKLETQRSEKWDQEGILLPSLKKFSFGAGILEKFLTEYTPTELKKMTKQHQILLPKIHQAVQILNQTSKKDSVKIQKYLQKKEHIIRRLKFFRKFFRKNSNPTFMILRNLPVLPPDLRPILKLQNQIAASDLNRFYQRILYRNERLKKFSKDSVTNQSFEMRYAQRLFQEAVDNLIQNGKGGVKPETNSRGQPLKSLSEILKGKQGRFRQYLLGKRVDYSGRSVIVVGPKLKLHECGLPKEMAFELFLPFLIQQILQLNLTKTVVGAKNFLKKDSDLAYHLLKKIMKNIPVLLNRAPTLHRLGFQAFFPKLVEGRAILLHPMVCPGFNADFDGDQMAVHIPLTVEARTEAWKFMLSTNNFINSATGEPILLPTQDMVLGSYYLTTDFQSKGAAFQISNVLRKSKKTNFSDFQIFNKSFLFYQNGSEVFSAYNRNEISLHTPVWVRLKDLIDFGKNSTKPLEIQLRKNGSLHQIFSKFTTFGNASQTGFPKPEQHAKNVYQVDSETEKTKFIRTTPGRIFMNSMIRDFEKSNK